jgi:hypothetical protein
MATISRLFDDYASASKAVQELESAGLSHDQVSIVASTPTTGTRATAPARIPARIPKVSLTVIGTARTTALKERRPALALVPRLVVPRDFSRG